MSSVQGLNVSKKKILLGNSQIISRVIGLTTASFSFLAAMPVRHGEDYSFTDVTAPLNGSQRMRRNPCCLS